MFQPPGSWPLKIKHLADISVGNINSAMTTEQVLRKHYDLYMSTFPEHERDEYVPFDEMINDPDVKAILPAMQEYADQQTAALREEKAQLVEIIEDKRRLCREIDIIMHGEEGAAKHPSLCDIMASVRDLVKHKAELAGALSSIIDLGRKDHSNPKYDDYYKQAKSIVTKHKSH